MSWGYSWSPYVSVSERKANAKRHIAAKQKKGFKSQPVEIEGRKITNTFWGDSWCNHLESFSDFENRLPRGRTYVRNGSVCHLEINAGEIKSIVSGSDIYNIKIKITKLPDDKWHSVKTRSTGQIGSLLDLLKGKLSKGVMAIVTDRKEGLFPLPTEIKMECSCPDWATMCKHVAATLYGVGARLDDQPELLFVLRGVDHRQLIAAETSTAALTDKGSKKGVKTIEENDLCDIFGIEILETATTGEINSQSSSPAVRSRPEKGRSATRSSADSSRYQYDVTQVRTKNNPQSQLSVSTGKTLRELREKFEMSQSQFARLIGVSAASVSNWEKERQLRPTALAAIAPVMRFSKKKAWEQAKQ